MKKLIITLLLICFQLVSFAQMKMDIDFERNPFYYPNNKIILQNSDVRVKIGTFSSKSLFEKKSQLLTFLTKKAKNNFTEDVLIIYFTFSDKSCYAIYPDFLKFIDSEGFYYYYASGVFLDKLHTKNIISIEYVNASDLIICKKDILGSLQFYFKEFYLSMKLR